MAQNLGLFSRGSDQRYFIEITLVLIITQSNAASVPGIISIDLSFKQLTNMP